MSETLKRTRAADLTPDEKRALLARLIREKSGLPSTREGLLHRLFETQAARTPDAVAVAFEDQALTYSALDARSNRLAHRLRRLGVGPEVLVGLCVDRSPEMVVALLGILKAGGAYVPIDPSFPERRLALILDDARVAVLLTEQRLRPKLPALPEGTRVLHLDSVVAQLEDEPDMRVAPSATAANLAYVIYTSGSTGRPKGVQVSHGALANFLGSMRQTLGITGRDALLAVTTLSFDIAALELFLPLTVGARVELVPREVAADGARLTARLRETGATFLQATPASWRLLLDAGWEGTPGLSMLCGGEALPRTLADQLLGRGACLWNLYGPTETTIWSSADRVGADPGPSVPIGRAIANTSLYVLDAQLRPVPIGVAGELYIGGAGLARGYLNRPALTAERFVPDPFSDRPGARIYRTGDLARWRSDGRLEYLGRLDHQVKIRGHRIELGEIEAVLAMQPGIRQAVVVAHEEPSGGSRLVAYLVPRDETAPTVATLRAALESALPDYMIPSAFVVRESLPLTPNGKLDRAALPAPEGDRSSASAGFVAPRDPVEETIAVAWSAVLGLPRIGVDDNYFELGGHSLLATQIVARVRDAFGVEVPLRVLFEAPTVAGLAAYVATARRAGLARTAPPIEPTPREGPVPLSFSQEALWFLDQLAPGQPTFNVTGAVRITGPLDIDALSKSFAEIIRRHEALRTTFAAIDGRPVQIIAPRLDTSLRVLDLRDRSEPQRAGEAQRVAMDEARRPFDLARGPLVRITLLRLGDLENALILTMHHIVTDGWSFGIAADELAALYEAYHRGRPSPLLELAIQYADFARWQRDWLQGDTRERLIDYWRRQLAGVAPLELRTDRPRPAVRTARGGLIAFVLPKGLSESLLALTRREGMTPFMTLLAAFQTLLHRYTGQADITVGTPIANRSRAETEGLIGYFVNMLALRIDLSDDPTFRALLRRVRAVALEAYEHQELPLEILVETLQPQRDLSRTPLFQVMFVLQNNRMPDLGRQELTLDPLASDLGTGTAKFDLTLAMHETPDGFAGGFEYNTDLFDASTIERMAGHLRSLLESIAANPERRISRLGLLTAEERSEILDRFANASGSVPGTVPALRGPESISRKRTFKGSPRPACIHERFEAQARRTPEAEAIVHESGCVTFAALNRRANRLAHHLRTLGVGPETRVGLYLDRLDDTLAGLLGVLKAGGAYVPLDPSLPSQRLAYLIDDARVSALLTQQRLVSGLPKNRAEVVVIDQINERALDETDPTPRAQPENLAYVIYTSGSLGQPKGVMISHASLDAMAQAWEDAYGLRSGPSRHLQMASVAFDVFTGDWVRALGTGGALVACPRDALLDPNELLALMRRERVDAAEFVPAVIETLIAHAEERGESLDFLRLVAVGSDLWQAGEYERLRRVVGPETRVINSYGLTEATIDSTYFEGDLSDRLGNRPVPIGRPFANARVHVLDRNLELVPIGVPGEVYVGGSGLARGYANRPGLTAERFIPDPFARAPGERLYRTGDLGRWLPDGNLELIGRLDHQVKIRGFRVELAEVEAALLQHPDVREAAAVASADRSGDRRLVAYVTTSSDRPGFTKSLRDFLKASLPRYMIPSAFMTLAALPLTTSGKVDRQALPPLDPNELERSDEFVAPRTPLEETLARAWSEVLGIERVGVHDDFFDLGGHSLQTVQLVARLSTLLKRPVSVKTVFQSSTVAAMAEALENAPAGPSIAFPSVLAPADDALPEHLTIEDRPLLPLFLTGKLGPPDSVAISYLPSSLLGFTGLTPEALIHGLCGNTPLITGFRETPWGRVAGIMIPRLDTQLYQDRRDLLDVLGDAVRLSRHIGAKTVSLTGLLPSATDYGRALAEALAGEEVPGITTGHATTTSAVVLAIRRALDEGGRRIEGERIGFVGLGSVGVATLRLLLSCLPHPAELTLCDVYPKQEDLRALHAELVDELGYRGPVRLVASRKEVPAEIYEATLIVGATNVPEILDVDRVAPGTILVDDSAPHLFSTEAALRRFRSRSDLLATEGGVLAAKAILSTTVHVPAWLDASIRAPLLSLLAASDPHQITGCVASCLLSARFAHLPPTLGLIDLRTARQHYTTLDDLGFEAARLHLDDQPLDERLVQAFRERHGDRGGCE
jgi:amino acid adenylation domain-containing protein